jgi:hypothetical protein
MIRRVEGLDLLDRLGQVLRRGHRVRYRVHLAGQVDGDDVGALLGQPDGVAAALAAGRAGDECDFSLYPSGHLPFTSAFLPVVSRCGRRLVTWRCRL